MPNVWISQAGAGNLSGGSFANRAPQTSFAALEATMVAGDTMFISAETITLTSVWTVTGGSKSFIGVNATTGVEDGSLATLDAGNARTSCITASGQTRCIFKNLDCTRATNTAIFSGNYGVLYNCTGRNSTVYGIFLGSYSITFFCKGNSNGNSGFWVDSHGKCFYCIAIGNVNGFFGGLGSMSNCIAHANTGSGVLGMGHIEGCVIDGNGNGINNNGSFSAGIIRSSITNNLTAITTNVTSTAVVYESFNYYQGNTTKFGGTVSSIFSLGGSVDGVIDPYFDRANDNFTPNANAPMKNTAYDVGNLNESTNFTYLNSGLNPITATNTPPVFAGIARFEILTNNSFAVGWLPATGTVTSYNIYIRDAAGVFTNAFLLKKVKQDLTDVMLFTLADNATRFTGGNTYFCGVKAENNGTEDSNTVELSNVCSGAEHIQRVNVVSPVVMYGQ